MQTEELEELKNKIAEIEDRIEEDEDFVFEDEFETLNDFIVEKYDEIKDNLDSYFDQDKTTKKKEEKVLAKLKSRIDEIQEKAGKESQEDIRASMFPDGDDNDTD